DKEQIDLAALIENIVNDFNPKAQKKGLILNFNSQIRKTVIKTNEYCVYRALINLIDNAIKYTEEGQVDVELKRKGKKLIATIVDTGIGISGNYLDRLFDPFSQESEGFTKSYQGVGLGMALTKRYLDMVNASIEIESTKGKGTKFTLTFN
ncbi:MAG: HAMP domain-containing sensor histidine kinase, partial [Candidatus Neomarinimicrobiota bacterium]